MPPVRRVRRPARPPARRTRPNRIRKNIKLLPVLRPQFNMREIIKQLTCLEDHHNHAGKRCLDCLRKHGNTIEALAEEAVTLCKGKKDEAIAREAAGIARRMRVLQHAWASSPKNHALNMYVGRQLRLMRKGLMRKYATLPVRQLPTREQNAVAAVLRQAKNRRRPLKRRPVRRRP